MKTTQEELDEIKEECYKQVDDVLKEYKNCEFWLNAILDRERRFYGEHRIHFIIRLPDTKPVNNWRLFFHPIVGAAMIEEYYPPAGLVPPEKETAYMERLSRIKEEINRRTAIKRFYIKKLHEENPVLTI